jgi:hypothetical protein
MLEVEQAGVTSEAQMRIEQMRQQMGLPAGGQDNAGQLAASSRQALGGDSQPAAALGTGAVAANAQAGAGAGAGAAAQTAGPPVTPAEGTGPAPASQTEG